MRLSAGGTRDLPGGGINVTAGSQAGAEEISTGPIRGGVTYAEDHVIVDNLGIDTITLRDFNYSGGKSLIQGKGASVVEKIAMTARIETPLRDGEKPDGDRYMSGIQITSLCIDRISGDDLRYRNYKSGLHASLQSGSLLGIHAEGANVDFGKTDNDAMLIRGGTAGFARAEGMRVAATTGSGLALTSMLNSQVLTANFADDGAIVADLQQIGATGQVTQKDLDLRFNAKARTLHLVLLPGAKGYEDSTQRFRLSGMSAEISGSKGKVSPTGEGPDPLRFAVGIDDLDTGEIIRTPDGTIRAPSVTIPEITVRHLTFDSPKLRIDVPDGANVILTAITADVTAEANPTPEAQRGKDESGFSRIVVHSFHVPIVTLNELWITLRDPDKGDMIVALPKGRTGVLKELRLGGQDENSEGLVIKPNEAWQMFGRLSLDQANLHGIGADLGKALISSVDADVTNFSVGFLGADDTVVAFDDLVATHLSGRLKDSGEAIHTAGAGTDPAVSDTIVSKLKRAGFTLTFSRSGVDAKVRLHGFKYSKAGLTLQELEIAGLRYEDPDRGLLLDIRSAILPAGPDGKPALEYTSSGKLIVPAAEINDAYFSIDDVLKVGGPAGQKAAAADNGLSFTPDLGVVDMLNGHVNFTVEPFARGGAGLAIYLAGPYAIRVNILNGKVNFNEVEDRSTGNLADAAVDIGLVNGSVDWDARPVRISPARLEIGILGADNYWWELDEQEAGLAHTGFVNLSTFFKHTIQTVPADPDAAPTKKSFLTNFFFGDLDIHLELPGNSEIALGNAGKLVLGGGTGPGFAIDVTSDAVPAISAAVPKLSANVASLDLQLDTAGTRLKTGAISVMGGNDIGLTFENRGVGPVYTDDDGTKTQNRLPMPTSLSGTISKATVRNIELQTVGDKKDKP